MHLFGGLEFTLFAFWLGLTLIVVVLSSLALTHWATDPEKWRKWYEELDKPWLAEWVRIHGVVWVLMMIASGVGAFLAQLRIFSFENAPGGKRVIDFSNGVDLDFFNAALGSFIAGLGLIVIWFHVLFRGRSLGWGSVVLFLAWLAAIIATVFMYLVHWSAGLAFTFYLVWITMALALNIIIWVYNTDGTWEVSLPGFGSSEENWNGHSGRASRRREQPVYEEEEEG